jgi:putative transposase
VLTVGVKEAAESGIQATCGFAGGEMVELNVQSDHVHLEMMVPPKLPISQLMGRLKDQTSKRLFTSSGI